MAIERAFAAYVGKAAPGDLLAQATLKFIAGHVECDHGLAACLHAQGGLALIGDADYFVHARSLRHVVFARLTGANTARMSFCVPWSEEGLGLYAAAREPAQREHGAALRRLIRAREAVVAIKKAIDATVGTAVRGFCWGGVFC